MRVMLINPNLPIYQRMPSLPLGLLSIASYLEAKGHDVLFVETLVEKKDIEEQLKNFSPDIVGISVMSFLAAVEAKKITSKIKKKNIPVVWGGQAPTALPELIFKETEVDCIVLGEGEETWSELLEAFEQNSSLSNVKGLAYRCDNQIKYTPIRPVLDISNFPDIDWGLVDIKKYFSTFFNCDKMVYLHASKGCPGQCTFCSNQIFHQSKNRCRDIDQILRDIDYLCSKGVNGVYFSDELWIPDKEKRIDFCKKLIKKEYNLVWGCQMRIGVLDEQDIDLMFKAGCRWILFGIESGNQDRIKNIHKNIDLSIVSDTVLLCEQKGITVQASFIIGFPGETESELKNTIKFANSLCSSLTVMNILIPLPNSKIYEEARRKGLYEFPDTIKEVAMEFEQKGADKISVNLSEITDLELKVIHFYYQWKAFANKKSVNDDSYGIIKKTIADAINRVFKHGIKGFFYGIYSSVVQFSTVFYYSHFFKGILKKYGIQ